MTQNVIDIKLVLPELQYKSIDFAPRDGTIVFTWHPKGDFPCFASYMKDEGGWRVLSHTRDGGLALHGNFGPFEPKLFCLVTHPGVDGLEAPAEQKTTEEVTH